MAKRTIDLSLSGFHNYDLQVFKNIVVTLFHDGHSVADAMTYLDSDISRLNMHPSSRTCNHCRKGFQTLEVYRGDESNAKYLCRSCGEVDVVEGTVYENAMKNLKSRRYNPAERLLLRWELEEFLNGGVIMQCPKCEAERTRLARIAEPEGPGNLKGYKSHRFCENENCDFEEFFLDPIEEILKKLFPGEGIL